MPRPVLQSLVVFFALLKDASSLSSVSAPNFFPPPLNPSQETRSTVKTEEIAVRIRTTTESDVSRGISDMWATSLVDAQQDFSNKGMLNFKRQMAILKAKPGIETLLYSRLMAIQCGEKTMEECSIDYNLDELTDADRLRYLWSNDGFRYQIEKAAGLSKEPHRWNGYNFACAPEDLCHLHHKMLTAAERSTETPVGFCEIAMLADPSRHAHEDVGLKLRPTIANLVVSPNHRRQGIASRIIKSASNFVQRTWQEDSLSLFVDKENKPAIALYEQLGFEKAFDAELVYPDRKQWYMTLYTGALDRSLPSKEERILSGYSSIAR